MRSFCDCEIRSDQGDSENNVFEEKRRYRVDRKQNTGEDLRKSGFMLDSFPRLIVYEKRINIMLG